MNHLSEEELILHYYGEEDGTLAAGRHLDECAECRALYGSLQRVLNMVEASSVPEVAPDYGARVWRRLQRHLPARRRWWRAAARWRWVAAGAALAGLLVAAFAAGRFYRRPPEPAIAKADPAAHEKILLVAVGDYLERSQLVLIELANANPKAPLDISAEQLRAGDLVSESRLYRQTAAGTGDTAVENVLDDVDRVLMDIARGPSELSPAELESLRRRLQAEGILLKIRIFGSSVTNRQRPEAQPAAGQKL
jgi:hypothetical protein